MDMPRKLIGLSILAAACGGCVDPPHSSTDAQPGRPLEGQYEDELAFVDIPVPRYFNYDPTASHKRVLVDRGNIRIAKLVYHGTRHVKDVVKFYDEYMVNPANGWKKIREETLQGRGEIELLFEKTLGPGRDSETCKVKIFRERAQTTVVIEIP